MGERRALVIGSQCSSLNLLSFLPEAARDVSDALLDPLIGGCVPALAGRPLLVDPTVTELDDAVTAAFERASEDGATLLLAVVGHGEYVDDDFYLMARDARHPPTSRHAFQLAQRVKELLRRHSTLDGLVLLLDTCHAGVGMEQAAQQWVHVVGQAGRRFEVLTASDDRTAANGCFSRSLVRTLRSGVSESGERLHCADLKPALIRACPGQAALHLAFDGRRITGAADDGLYLGHNPASAWRDSPLLGTPTLSEVERLTRHHCPTRTVRQVVAEVLSGRAVVLVQGEPGSGKATVLAALANPRLASADVPLRFLNALVLVVGGRTDEDLADDLADQLRRTVPGFAAASAGYRDAVDEQVWAAADHWQRILLGPLELLGPPDRPIRIGLVDGGGDRWSRLLDWVVALGADRDVQIVLATTHDYDSLGGSTSIVTPAPPTPGQIQQYLRGRNVPEDLIADYRPGAETWQSLAALGDAVVAEPTEAPRLLRGVVDEDPNGSRPPGPTAATARNGWPVAELLLSRIGDPAAPENERTAAVLRLLCVLDDQRNDPGPALPVTLLAVAAARSGEPAHVAHVREVLVQLGDLVSRSDVGTGTERVGLAVPRWFVFGWFRAAARQSREAFARSLLALADAIAEVAPMGDHDRARPEHAFAEAAEADLLWAVGRYAEALDSVEARAAAAPMTNVHRWERWLARAEHELGPDHPLTLLAAARRATSLAKAGDVATAIATFDDLRDRIGQTLGAEHPQALSVRHNLAYWQAESGDTGPARAEFARLVTGYAERFGPEHPDALDARLQEAVATAKDGDPAAALGAFADLLPTVEATLGPEHKTTVNTRANLVFWGQEIGHPPPRRGDAHPAARRSRAAGAGR